MANEIQIEWPQLFEVIANLAVDEHHDIIVKRQAIPLIFVPGIMGSRLRKKQNKEMVWDPDDAVLMLKAFGLKQFDPAGRKALIVGKKFSPSYLEVDPDGSPKTNAKNFEKFPKAVERGWTTVSWNSYGAFLSALERHDWGRLTNLFEFPVHAFGYNWTADNYDAGKDLKAYITKTIAEYKGDYICEKAIILTHSMGGLVARSACGIHGAAGEVEAVIHGVQPASGAPAAYWRMKAGFERPGSAEDAKWYHWFSSPKKMAEHKLGGTVASWVLGPDGPSVTALLANIPGGLELLPTKSYKTNDGERGWLVLAQPDGSIARKPAADPYQEIYLARDVYWRLVKPEWLDEASKTKGKTQTKDGMPVRSTWGQYERVLGMARSFHDSLGDYVHPKTLQFYSEGIHTFHEVVYEREFHSWTSTGKRILKNMIGAVPGQAASAGIKNLLFGSVPSPVTAGTMLLTATVKDSDWYVGRGGYRAYVDEQDREVQKGDKADALFLLTLKLPAGSGDGTVPVSSGKHLRAETTKKIGDREESWLARGHEPIYKTKTGQKISFAAVNDFTIDLIVKPKVG